jgi:hypothetical protein
MAAEKVKERMRRAAAALEQAGVPYAVIGGNAVAEWVGRADEAAVRNTRDVDILLPRQSLDAAKVAMEAVGFIYRHVRMIDMFLDGRGSKVRDAVHVIFSGEKVRNEDAVPAPEIAESEKAADASFRVVSLEALVRMKLTSYRLKDQVHLQDMIEVELIDESWLSRFPQELADRLRKILDNPNM